MKSNYSVKIIARSIAPSGIKLTTAEIEYPRFIHSELMTHRMLAKNAASSRAVPIDALINNIKDNTAQPLYWGANKKGMSADEEISDIPKAIIAWNKARDNAIDSALELSSLGVHKQTANRLLEPFVVMKTIISGTDWANFFWLRDHKAAQPEFRYLAQLLRAALEASSPNLLKHGEWHLPYVNTVRDESGTLIYLDNEGLSMPLDEARKISASCCAQVSYRKLDDTKDKCFSVYDRLMSEEVKHASPTEHQGTPIDFDSQKSMDGITHMTKDGMLWSGPFKGWIQFRKLIPNEAVW